MTLYVGLLRRATARVSVAALVVSLLLLWPAGTAGSCDGPVPSFRESVATADTIIVGTVVSIRPMPEDPPGFARVFDLRVDHVLRGQSDAMITVRDLVQSPCSGLLLVPDGASIALALGAKAFQPPIDVNAPAFIEGISYRAVHGMLGPAETITLAEVFAVAGVPVPNTAAPEPGSSLLPLLILALLVSCAGLGVALLRWRPRSARVDLSSMPSGPPPTIPSGDLTFKRPEGLGCLHAHR